MFWYVEQLSMTAIRFNTGGTFKHKSHVRVHEMSLGDLWF